ncbi:glucan 1,3-beta-glucosidase [Trichosporon asahii var. asahii CBS 2479]|uniref:Glucan 1,3-beta-glucosidase n=1 Tax=Trichosporon asahii var. asahii (strain ATCC 90039 / CBS 2479 / JCM 2466 / KCTC 7840 / NBRC 103889/ NCYC 2677 / UAMH 7654) TaxID=1186058 RepID=J6EX48_TRIAS|nr:glucan 1,3-beta-glucosidase [Trichosporon asahii var. asahii CBS 2479]EJT49209.1 glucan 1,3-beta-glucosidase [Trichosporon asahii var. asahii CBS 2479]
MTLLLVLALLAVRAALVASRAFDALETDTLATLAARAPAHSAHSPRGLVKRGGWFNYDEWKVRGVNLGGWLVLEPWITPSLFDGKPDWVVDEWTYAEFTKDNRSELERHWDTWITEQDLRAIAGAGLNTVRIPVGYWSLIPLEDEPFHTGAYPYLQKAVQWARSSGLNVILDLHGAPGSQNGFDNSGRRDQRSWFQNQHTADRAVDAVLNLVREFTKPEYGGAVSAIQLLNEPFPHEDWELSFVKDFYTRAYRAVREIDGDILVILHEAFRQLDTWRDAIPEAQRVALDTHIYAMFTPSILSYGYVDNLRWSCGFADTLPASPYWTIVGEFSLANTDCAPALNGRGRGARWDNTLSGAEKMKFPGNCAERTGPDPEKWSDSYKQQLSKSWQTQTWVYERAKGWVYWTWRTEAAADWSLLTGLSHRFIPTPITALPDGQPCNFSSFIHNSRYARDEAAAARIKPSLLDVVALAALALLEL